MSPTRPDQLLDHGRVDCCSTGADSLGRLDQLAAVRDAVLQQVTDTTDSSPEHSQRVVRLQVLRRRGPGWRRGTGP